jgi:hypothetical protein
MVRECRQLFRRYQLCVLVATVVECSSNVIFAEYAQLMDIPIWTWVGPRVYLRLEQHSFNRSLRC